MKDAIHYALINLLLVLTILTGSDARDDRHDAEVAATALVQAEIRLVVAHHRSLSWCAPVESMDWCADEIEACRRR